jgi:hypothetical protein
MTVFLLTRDQIDQLNAAVKPKPKPPKCRLHRIQLVQSPRNPYVASCPECGVRHRVDPECYEESES